MQIQCKSWLEQMIRRHIRNIGKNKDEDALPMFKPQTEWIPPTDFPDLGKV